MAQPLTVAERRRRRAEQAGGLAVVLVLPVLALMAFVVTGALPWLLAAVVLLAASILVARQVARRGRTPRNFVEACCHRVDGALRAGPPAQRPPSP